MQKRRPDAERMGGLGATTSPRIARPSDNPERAAWPEEVHGYFAEMGTIAVDLGNRAPGGCAPRMIPNRRARISQGRRRDGRVAQAPVHGPDGQEVEATVVAAWPWT